MTRFIAACALLVPLTSLATEKNFAEMVVSDYKIERTSSLAVCKGKAEYIRFHKVKVPYEDTYEYKMKIATTAKEAGQIEDDYSSSDSLSDVQDINGDGLRDFLVSKGDCGSDGACVFDIYVSCGKGRYVSVVGEAEYFYEPSFSKEKKEVAGAFWLKLETGIRHRESSSKQCENGIDFVVSGFYEFNGKKYEMTKAESKRVDKDIEKQVKKEKKDCQKSK